MASNKRLPGDERPEDYPNVTDTRTYSDFILYFERTGRFQSNSILDTDRRMGVITLLKANRITKLSLDRRLSPVQVTLTPGQPPNKVFLFAIVRRAVSKEELADIIARMNAYMEGMTKEEKEMAVTELIFSTGSRVQPGVRYLPDRLYEENSVPPNTMVDEHGRDVDGEGLPLVDTEDEVIAFQHGNYSNSQSDDVRMPSARAILSDPSTDSDSPLRRKRQQREPQDKLPWQDSSDEEPQPTAKTGQASAVTIKEEQEDNVETSSSVIIESSVPSISAPTYSKLTRHSQQQVPPDTQQDPVHQEPPDNVEEPPANVEEPPANVEEPPANVEEPPANDDDVNMDDFMVIDRDEPVPRHGDDEPEHGGQDTATEPLAQPGSSRTQTDTIAELKSTIETLAAGVKDLKTQVDVLTQFQQGPLADFLQQGAAAAKEGHGDPSRPPSVGQQSQPAQGESRDRSGASSRAQTPPYYNDVEDDLAKYFPINEYTMPMNWLLKKPIVQRFIYYEVIRRAYRTHPVFKPDAEFIIGIYMDFLMSPRLQTHFGKSTGTGGTMDFARCPMPQVVVEIADTVLLDLGKRRVPGTRTNADAIKDRCNNVRRFQVLGSDYIKDATSRQEMAHRLLGERQDFYERHMWLFPSRSAQELGWTFEVELKKATALTVGASKPDDPTFNKDQPMDPDFEVKMFPNMTVKPPLRTIHEAEILVARLLESKVTVPTYPADVWALIKAVVLPSPEEVAAAKRLLQKKQATHAAKLERRRKRRKEKSQAHEDDSDTDDDDDPGDMEQSPPKAPRQEKDSAGAQAVVAATPPFVGPLATGARPKVPMPTGRKDYMDVVFRAVNDNSSAQPSDQATMTIQDDGTVRFVQKGPIGLGHQPEQEPGFDSPSKDYPLASNSSVGVLRSVAVMDEATRAGLATGEANVVVATDFASTNEGTYSVIVDHPNMALSQQTVVQGNMVSTSKVNETMSRPGTNRGNSPKHRSLAELYDTLGLATQVNSKQGDKTSGGSTASGEAAELGEEQPMFDAQKFFDQVNMPPPEKDSARSKEKKLASATGFDQKNSKKESEQSPRVTRGMKRTLAMDNSLLQERMKEHKKRRS